MFTVNSDWHYESRKIGIFRFETFLFLYFQFSPLRAFFLCEKFCTVSHMASGNDPPSNDDNEEGLNVEIDNTNVTTFRMTGTNRDSSESANEIADPVY